MPAWLTRRFLFEAGFLLLVAFALGAIRLRPWWAIVLVMGLAWLVVAFVEWSASRDRLRLVGELETGGAEIAEPEITLRPADHDEEAFAPAPPPSDEDRSAAAAPADQPAEPPRVEPGDSARSAPSDGDSVPPDATRPAESVAPPAREVETAVRVSDGERTSLRAEVAPRQWNLWQLERMARERAGADVARDEEWAFLFVYLREFAGADGLLPIDFDPLVRESFRELIEEAERR